MQEEQRQFLQTKPWLKDPNYFKQVAIVWLFFRCGTHSFATAVPLSDHPFSQVKISALALLKMVMHARSGGNIEIMGCLQARLNCKLSFPSLHRLPVSLPQGKLEPHTFVVIDVFALPVEGTETRVTALNEGCAAAASSKWMRVAERIPLR